VHNDRIPAIPLPTELAAPSTELAVPPRFAVRREDA
jgi:hypothetical protein